MYASLLKLFFFLTSFLLTFEIVMAIDGDDIDIRRTSGVTIGDNSENSILGSFIGSISEYFYTPITSGDMTVPNFFISIA